MKIELTNQQVQLLEMGTKINTKDGNTYYFLPYWYKKVDNNGMFEELNWDKLPEGVKKYIENQKEKK